MSTQIELTLACGDYEIMRALKEGTVKPDGIDLKVVTAMDSADTALALPARARVRHRRSIVLVLHCRAR